MKSKKLKNFFISMNFLESNPAKIGQGAGQNLCYDNSKPYHVESNISIKKIGLKTK